MAESGTTVCLNLINATNSLKIRKFINGDERKYSIFPVNTSNTQSKLENFITIGVGKDIDAELHYKNETEKLPFHINTKFYGADPMFMDNYELYSKIGLFFPLAISGSDGYINADVLMDNRYQSYDVFHIEFIYYLKNILKISTIDNLWMDSENAEYELLQYFYKNGELDDAGITICQINMEVHSFKIRNKTKQDERLDKFKMFFWHIVNDQRYAILNHDVGVHHRLYLFNYADKYCVEKYLGYSL
ncbi:unnamed protein product [Caenorhabditis angaria]|uniref:Methyltransferase FkbM domain-containing protein n=1 Tax=Caenorhabditis angaria TaxID=860376 RepID=A0A9P1N9Q4_9PELO|nr:unnamed protein product [Caenorhabditis angaria]